MTNTLSFKVINPWTKTLAACSLLVVALAGYKIMQIRAVMAFAESFPEPSETVTAASPLPQSYQASIRVIGETVAVQRAELRSELAGRIVEVGFKSGARVDKDQLLLQQDISEEQAQLAAARARSDLAATILRRNEQLKKTQAVSQEQLDRARAELAEQRAAIAALQSTIRKKTIRAPFAGATSIHQFEAGEFLLDNILVSTVVGEQDFIWVDFKVPQFYPPLANGTPVQLASIEAGHRSSDESQWVEATVQARSAELSSANRSYQYRAQIKRSDLNAPIHAAVAVEVPVAAARQLLSLPLTAIQYDPSGQFIYLLQRDDSGVLRAQRQAVTVDAQLDGRALIGNGLLPEQQIANEGAFKLYPGIRVVLDDGAGP